MSIARELEAYAKWVRKNRRKKLGPIRKVALETEIVLLLERLEHFRRINKSQLRTLLNEECELGTGLLNLEANEIRFNCHHVGAKDLLKQKLSRKNSSERRLTNKYEKYLAEIFDRLSGQIGLHKMLRGEEPQT